MMTIEDMLRLATQAGEGALIANIARAAAPPRIPADLLRECERAAGLTTADTSKEATAP